MAAVLHVSWHGGPPGRQWAIQNPDLSWPAPITLVSGNEGDSSIINGDPYLCYAQGQPGFQPGVNDTDVMFCKWATGAVPVVTGLRVGISTYGNQDRTHAFSPGDPAFPNRVLLVFTPYNAGASRSLHLGRSNNLGVTWTDLGVLPTTGAVPVADMHNPYGVLRSDGVVRIYWQAYDPVGSPHYTIYYVESTDHGHTFGAAQLVAYPGGVNSASRPTICEDRTAGVPNGTLYVYTSYGANNSTVGGWRAETASPGTAKVVVPNDGIAHFAGSICWDGTQFVIVYMQADTGTKNSIRTATAPSLAGPWTLADLVRGPSSNTGVDPTIQVVAGGLPPPPPPTVYPEVFNTLLDPPGSGGQGSVSIQLVDASGNPVEGWDVVNQRAVQQPWRERLSGGLWRTGLVPNANIVTADGTQGGTFYLVSEWVGGVLSQTRIQMLATGGPYLLSQLMA